MKYFYILTPDPKPLKIQSLPKPDLLYRRAGDEPCCLMEAGSRGIGERNEVEKDRGVRQAGEANRTARVELKQHLKRPASVLAGDSFVRNLLRPSVTVCRQGCSRSCRNR